MKIQKTMQHSVLGLDNYIVSEKRSTKALKIY